LGVVDYQAELGLDRLFDYPCLDNYRSDLFVDIFVYLASGQIFPLGFGLDGRLVNLDNFFKVGGNVGRRGFGSEAGDFVNNAGEVVKKRIVVE